MRIALFSIQLLALVVILFMIQSFLYREAPTGALSIDITTTMYLLRAVEFLMLPSH